ncbi:MAG: hypothetical protein WAM10_08410 [Methylocella sp.]
MNSPKSLMRAAAYFLLPSLMLEFYAGPHRQTYLKMQRLIFQGRGFPTINGVIAAFRPITPGS